MPICLARAVISLFFCSSFAVACASTEDDPPETLGAIDLALSNVPANVFCVRVVVAGADRAVARLLDAKPGAPLLSKLSGLPTGDVSVLGEAFPVACSQATAATEATWLSDPVAVTLVPGVPLSLKIKMKRNGRIDAEIDFGSDEVIVDQSFVSPHNAGAAINEGARYIAQTYTAHVSGTLTGVAVNILGARPSPLRVAIHGVSSGLPDGTVLGETKLATNGSSLDDVITFTSVIPQVAGEQYAIVVDYPDAPPAGAGMLQGTWQGAFGNAYAEGIQAASNNGVSWGPDASFDLHFKTFVLPD